MVQKKTKTKLGIKPQIKSSKLTNMKADLIHYTERLIHRIHGHTLAQEKPALNLIKQTDETGTQISFVV